MGEWDLISSLFRRVVARRQFNWLRPCLLVVTTVSLFREINIRWYYIDCIALAGLQRCMSLICLRHCWKIEARLNIFEGMSVALRQPCPNLAVGWCSAELSEPLSKSSYASSLDRGNNSIKSYDQLHPGAPTQYHPFFRGAHKPFNSSASA